jgi:hypothetical protein
MQPHMGKFILDSCLRGTYVHIYGRFVANRHLMHYHVPQLSLSCASRATVAIAKATNSFSNDRSDVFKSISKEISVVQASTCSHAPLEGFVHVTPQKLIN